MRRKTTSKASLIVCSAFVLLISGGCENVCDYHHEDCRPHIDAIQQVALDGTKPVAFSFTRYIQSAPVVVVITQKSANNPTFTLSADPPDCQNTASSPPVYSCKILIDPSELKKAGFKIGTASVNIQDARDGSPTLDAANSGIELPLVYSQFIFHLDNAGGSGVLTEPPETTENEPLVSKLVEAKVIGSKMIRVARKYFSARHDIDISAIYMPTYKPSKMLTGGEVLWGSPSQKKILSDTIFITDTATWSIRFDNTRSRTFLDKDGETITNASLSPKGSRFVISKDQSKAVLLMPDNSVQWFLAYGTPGQPPKRVAPKPTDATVQALEIFEPTAELLVATSDYKVARYDPSSLQPQLPAFLLEQPDDKPGSLQALGVGSLGSQDAPRDALVGSSDDRVYIWLMPTMGSNAQLVSELPRLPAKSIVQRVAVGDVDGLHGNDIVVITEDNMYVFLNDPAPQ